MKVPPEMLRTTVSTTRLVLKMLIPITIPMGAVREKIVI